MAYVHAEYAVHLSDGLYLVEWYLHDGLLPDASPDGHALFSQTGVGVSSMLVCHFDDERHHGLLCGRQSLPVHRHTLNLGFLLRHANHCVGSQHTLCLNSQCIHEHNGSNQHPFQHFLHTFIYYIVVNNISKTIV